MSDGMQTGEISMEEYRQIIRGLLRDFHTLCEENELRYFAAYGTLLGAVRHDGFIPWDDDVDVCMPREDYDKLLSFVDSSDPRHYILSPDNSEYYYSTYSRFCSRKGRICQKGFIEVENLGPFIDIFPLDSVPSDEKERHAYYRESERYSALVKYSLPRRFYRSIPAKRRVKMALNLPKRIPAVLQGTKALKEERERVITRYRGKHTGLLAATFDLMSDDYLVTEEEAQKLELHVFEDLQVYIPSDYDAVLRRVYGDYMQLPPEEARVPKHNFTPRWN